MRRPRPNREDGDARGRGRAGAAQGAEHEEGLRTGRRMRRDCAERRGGYAVVGEGRRMDSGGRGSSAWGTE